MKRQTWIDILRIVLTWGVISIHGKYCYSYELMSFQWIQYMIIGSMMTCCVPIFLMISGALVLRDDSNPKKTLFRRIIRITSYLLGQYVICSLTSVIINCLDNDHLTMIEALKNWNSYAFGRSFFWIMLGCYICTPFLYSIVKSKELMRYFLIIGAVFGLVIPGIVDTNIWQIPYVSDLARNLDYSEVLLPVGATYIFVLGYYLSTDFVAEISKRIIRHRKIIAFMTFGVFAAIWIYVAMFSTYISEKGDSLENHPIICVLRYGRYYDTYVSPAIILYSATVFCLFMTLFKNVRFSAETEMIISRIAQKTIYVFIIHGCVISVMRPRIPHLFTTYPFVSVCIDSTVYFVLALAVSELYCFIKNRLMRFSGYEDGRNHSSLLQ